MKPKLQQSIGEPETPAPLAPAPGDRKKALIASAEKRPAKREPPPTVEVEKNGEGVKISNPHSDTGGFGARLLETFGTPSREFAEQQMAWLASIVRSKDGTPHEGALNAAIATLDGLKPRDEIEAQLAVQMVATHEMAMTMLRRVKLAETTLQQQENGTLATKLLRTYVLQAEALAKLRRGGEQRVIVQHVNVNDGGQAIVGAVNRGGDLG